MTVLYTILWYMVWYYNPSGYLSHNSVGTLGYASAPSLAATLLASATISRRFTHASVPAAPRAITCTASYEASGGPCVQPRSPRLTRNFSGELLEVALSAG